MVDGTQGQRAGSHRGEYPDHGCWLQPGTGHIYPLEFEAYRRRREAEERPLRGHRGLGPDVDRYVWQRWGHRDAQDVEIVLTVRADASPRIRRLVAEVLRRMRRGRSAGDAIRQVSRRFSLRQTQIRTWLAGSLGFTTRSRGDAITRLSERPWFA